MTNDHLCISFLSILVAANHLAYWWALHRYSDAVDTMEQLDREVDRLESELDKSTWEPWAFSVYLDGIETSSHETDERLYRDLGCEDFVSRLDESGCYLRFHRKAPSLERAISWAAHDAETAGYLVTQVELDRESVGLSRGLEQ